jgi:hypothetical protein
MSRRRALAYYLAAACTLAAGTATAVAYYPGRFDWVYTVISRLASRTHNPAGGTWLAAALLTAMLLLWPVTGYLRRTLPEARRAIIALRTGLIGGTLLGMEGLLQLELSALHRKGHEILALLTFAGLYGGMLGIYGRMVRQQTTFLIPALVVVIPLLAVGTSQAALWFDQRDLGWVNTGWREMGVPFWLSFAFWQWLATAMLWLGLGQLLLTAGTGARRSHS